MKRNKRVVIVMLCVDYIPSGNSANLLNNTDYNNRYNVNAYGYNSNWNDGWYSGWIIIAYYQP